MLIKTIFHVCLVLFQLRSCYSFVGQNYCVSNGGNKGVVTCLSATRPEQKLYIPEEDDTKGFQPGDKIKVLKDVKLWHVNGFRDEGISAQGMEGEVVNIWLRSRKNLKEVTVNLPLVVQFTEPTSFKAHFDFDEVEKLH
mmetsp:Transcript_4144/g.5742  ORF Transcript_4144/g.5742 Transcript_4144/m.5742 type:complete len:139 (-) Transcript_4144:445-861(-)